MNKRFLIQGLPLWTTSLFCSFMAIGGVVLFCFAIALAILER